MTTVNENQTSCAKNPVVYRNWLAGICFLGFFILLVLPVLTFEAYRESGSITLLKLKSYFGGNADVVTIVLLILPLVAGALTLIFKSKGLRWIPAVIMAAQAVFMCGVFSEFDMQCSLGFGCIMFAILAVAYIVVNILSPKIKKNK